MSVKISDSSITTKTTLDGTEQVPINNGGSKGRTLFSHVLDYIRQATAVFTVASVNKVAITAPASSATLTIANGKTLAASASITLAGTDGKTLTVNKNLTLDGTDGRTHTFPSSNSTVARTDAGQTFVGANTFSSKITASAGIDVSSTGNLAVVGSGYVGYGSGAGATVTQLTSVTTGVTCNKRTGFITTVSATTAAGSYFEFVLTNSYIASDSIVIGTASNGGAGQPSVKFYPDAGTCIVRVTNDHASAAFNAVVEISFAIINHAVV